ncbi:hypothetical protein Glove_346g191 [Diversispora epigaea]|uniref:Apple domain-containing protein n=1 Tax=Diversispora epigaea TaxID=1348612 RepID=A0A397HEV4_9GLOM|nr:hypothetical protein Glove_346g191 [Diversispora epigaea]
MNLRTFNLSSIILLFFILTQIITIDAQYRDICVVTTVIPKTITLATCSSRMHTQTYKAPQRDFKKHCRTTKTVTCKPTVTHCATGCEVAGGPGWKNMVHSSGGLVITNDTTPQACCKSCMADPNCVQWEIFKGVCEHNIIYFNHFNYLIIVGDTCVEPLSNFNNSGIIRQLVCFYLRKTSTEAILGIGISIGNNRSAENGELIISEFDLFSYEAYRDHYLRSGIWGDSIKYFLPLALSAVHFEKVLPIIKSSLMRIRDYTEWNSELVLKTIPGLMSSMVVNLMKACDDNRHQSSSSVVRKVSEKALQGYCLLLHLLIMLSKKYPEVITEAEKKVENFIENEQPRRFRHTVAIICNATRF